MVKHTRAIIWETERLCNSIEGYSDENEAKLREQKKYLEEQGFKNPFRHLRWLYVETEEQEPANLADVKKQIKTILYECSLKKWTWERVADALACQLIAKRQIKYASLTQKNLAPYLAYHGDWFLKIMETGKQGVLLYHHLSKFIENAAEQKITKKTLRTALFIHSRFIRRNVLVAIVRYTLDKHQGQGNLKQHALETLIEPVKVCFEHRVLLYPTQRKKQTQALLDYAEK